MTAEDVAEAAAVMLRGEWGERTSWFRFAVEHPSCDPVVAVDGGEIVGTGVGTRHGNAGWVGTIFVAPERRGEGIGLWLGRVVSDGLEAAGCRTLVLAATPAGRPVYERLGFGVTDAYVVLEHPGLEAEDVASPDVAIRPIVRSDLEEVAALDRVATGEDRSVVLAAVADLPGGLALRRAGGSLGGFVLHGPWPGGATIAPDADDALRLARARLAAHPGGRVVTGLLASNAAGLERFTIEGWTEIRRIVRMERGASLEWRPDWIWGQLSFALG